MQMFAFPQKQVNTYPQSISQSIYDLSVSQLATLFTDALGNCKGIAHAGSHACGGTNPSQLSCA